MKYNLFSLKTLIIACFLFLASCVKENIDPVTGKKSEPWEPNSDARARKYADENPIFIIGGKDKKNSPSQTQFNTSNVLWRATLKSLDFLPLQNTDNSGGIIVYDWYSQTNNPREQIKISVHFLSNEIRTDSIKVTAHKKICETADRCSNSTLDQNFANSVKDSIITSARTLKIEEAKKEKK